MFLKLYGEYRMSVEKINVSSTENNKPAARKNILKANTNNVENSQISTAAQLMIGASALAGLVALGIAGRKGHLGEKVQQLLGGAKKSVDEAFEQCSQKPHQEKLEEMADDIAEIVTGKETPAVQEIPVMQPSAEAQKIYENTDKQLHSKSKLSAESIDQNLKPQEKAGSWKKEDIHEYYSTLNTKLVDEAIKSNDANKLQEVISELDIDEKLSALDKYFDAVKQGETEFKTLNLSELSTKNVYFEDGHKVISDSHNSEEYLDEVGKIADKYIQFVKENPKYTDEFANSVIGERWYQTRHFLFGKLADSGIKPTSLSDFDRIKLHDIWMQEDIKPSALKNMSEDKIKFIKKMFLYDMSIKIDTDLADYFNFYIKRNPHIAECIGMTPDEMSAIISKNSEGKISASKFNIEHKKPSVRLGTAHSSHHYFHGWNGNVKNMIKRDKGCLADIDEEFKHLIPQDHECIVYRGRSRRTGDVLQADFDIIKNAKTGDIIVPHDAYSYTGFNKGLASNWAGYGDEIESMMMEIRTPAGARLSCNMEHGGEAVFPRNAKYKLVSKETQTITGIDGKEYPQEYVVLEYILPEIK